ncbi:hypothetical protein BMW22_37575 (plasmid) [Rhizobium leguminosarum]|uniref:Uncharacterized protein n=1 Tax=Rhizobium leguminosarum TaxID=384 RepID=A0A1L3ZN91_RHILE|nr:hypothetical protein [Rhizobium leguminosarum]API57135.1 hypothetical protein BMW22_37575 [Rhizobium leguminosarum]
MDDVMGETRKVFVETFFFAPTDKATTPVNIIDLQNQRSKHDGSAARDRCPSRLKRVALWNFVFTHVVSAKPLHTFARHALARLFLRA